MSWWEMNHTVECPHCGEDNYETVSFDMDEADQHGVNSKLHQFECGECFKKYWSRFYMAFEIEETSSFKKKPKEKK